MEDAEAPRVIGHRGVAGYAPENTLASVQYAASLGVKWVEVDVKITSDEVPVLFHDNRLERTTDGMGYVARKSLAELKTLDAGAWFGRPFIGQRIPTLAEGVEELERLALGLNLELKPSPGLDEKTGRIVAECVQTLWPAELPAPVISSFKPLALVAFAKVAPVMSLALLVHKVPHNWFELANSIGVSAFHCDSRYLERHHVTSIRESGLTVRCFTVNEEKKALRLFSWGVASVFSDFPDRIT